MSLFRSENSIGTLTKTALARIRNWYRNRGLKRFVSNLKIAFPVGTVVTNPGGGTSTIVGVSESTISYIRGRSTIVVRFTELYDAYSNFKGGRCTSSDLRAYKPGVFDSTARPAGHSCNCTFLFRALEALRISGPITGTGVRGNPFSVDIR